MPHLRFATLASLFYTSIQVICFISAAIPSSLGNKATSPGLFYRDIITHQHFAKRGDPDVLPPHYWRLAKNQNEIDEFQEKYNLTLVTSIPQDAALLPGWPQALLQYLLVNPVINLSYSSSVTHTSEFTRNGVVTSYSHSYGWDLGIWDVLQYLVAPPCFIAWIISFARIQNSERSTAGWVSILGWGTWICFAFDMRMPLISYPALILALFQWCSSLAIIVQRWTRSIGTVAYLVTDLHGCTPHEGLTYLQGGIRSRPYRIIQLTTFLTTTVWAFLCGQNVKSSINGGISLVGFAELVYSCVVATKGMPIVVSGDCFLVELSPRLGYLDSSISTSWKVLSGFMGF